jgi:hypothetical protein
MNGHHLILGQLTDYISGRILDDTLDERYRQRLGRLLVEEKGFAKSEITSRYELKFKVDHRCARLRVTYIVTLGRHIGMILHFGPGSLVTRHRPVLAMARLVTGYQVPVVVVTNGDQADVLEGGSGRRVTSGLEMIPDRDQLAAICDQWSWPSISKERANKEARILMAFEVDDRCPCDDSVCATDF